ncbi:hypothetical protein BLNAU_2823 [Blattamonas nauphoetae]|uniref:RING-type domain-containing protein n=1 Tax=Blattamonas nauphoetae TaxID=2049346 RepID=A0ABQ9YEG4_9EUKA|nr:hypothetical protein BLNAU_2823 [Blattamonas nauphoetae]
MYSLLLIFAGRFTLLKYLYGELMTLKQLGQKRTYGLSLCGYSMVFLLLFGFCGLSFAGVSFNNTLHSLALAQRNESQHGKEPTAKIRAVPVFSSQGTESSILSTGPSFIPLHHENSLTPPNTVHIHHTPANDDLKHSNRTTVFKLHFSTPTHRSGFGKVLGWLNDIVDNATLRMIEVFTPFLQSSLPYNGHGDVEVDLDQESTLDDKEVEPLLVGIWLSVMCFDTAVVLLIFCVSFLLLTFSRPHLPRTSQLISPSASENFLAFDDDLELLSDSPFPSSAPVSLNSTSSTASLVFHLVTLNLAPLRLPLPLLLLNAVGILQNNPTRRRLLLAAFVFVGLAVVLFVFEQVSILKGHRQKSGHSSQLQCLSPSSTCPICQDSFHDPYQLPCGHNFCRLCLESWITVHPSCPLCREVITISGEFQMSPIHSIICYSCL